MIWIWLAVIILALVCEACTTALVSIWFVPSALVSLILAIADVDVWVQVLVFFVISAACIVIFQSLFRKKLANGKKKATNTDILIGEKAIVTASVSEYVSLKNVEQNEIEVLSLEDLILGE